MAGVVIRNPSKSKTERTKIHPINFKPIAIAVNSIKAEEKFFMFNCQIKKPDIKCRALFMINELLDKNYRFINMQSRLLPL